MYRQLAAFAVSLLTSINVLAATAYHGFVIDDHLLSADQRAAYSPAAADSVIEQLKIVESVGLPEPVLAAMKRTSILVDPDLRGQPGVFAVQGDEAAVRIKPTTFPADKPILLHELLHAYHYSVLGMRNQQIQDAYRFAKSQGLFPRYQAAHFLENAKEYFAVTGTLYLFGDIQQPPFTCAVLSRLGDDYLAFLAVQFGRHECHSQAAGG